MRQANLQNCRNLQRQIGEKLLDFAMRELDPEILPEAWQEFSPPEDSNQFDVSHPLTPCFMAWFMYNWIDDLNDNKSIAELFLETKDNISSTEKEILLSGISTKFTFCEAVDVIPGESVTIFDILTEESMLVYEKQGTINLNPGDILMVKTISVQKINLFEAMAPILIPTKFKIDILRFKHHLLSELGKFKNEEIDFISQLDTLELFQEIYEEVTNPTSPVITNTDGELLIPHKLIFEIKSAKEAFDKLHHLCHQESKAELLSHASCKGDQILKIEFPWLDLPTKKKPRPIVLGNVIIESNKMTVEVNSKERTSKFNRVMKKCLPKGSFKLKSTLIESLEAKMSAKNVIPQPQSQTMPPELLEVAKQYFKDHWEQWPKEKLPALGNKRPIDVVKTKKGKELVSALISDFEQTLKSRPMPGMSQDIFTDLREKLDIQK